MSVLSDLLNPIRGDGCLESSRAGEVSLAIEQAAHVPAGDIVINDRGFTGFHYLAGHVHRGVYMVGRCSSGLFASQRPMAHLVELILPTFDHPRFQLPLIRGFLRLTRFKTLGSLRALDLCLAPLENTRLGCGLSSSLL